MTTLIETMLQNQLEYGDGYRCIAVVGAAVAEAL